MKHTITDQYAVIDVELDSRVERAKYLRRARVKNFPDESNKLDFFVTERCASQNGEPTYSQDSLRNYLKHVKGTKTSKKNRHLVEKVIGDLGNADIVEVSESTTMLVMDEVERWLLSNFGIEHDALFGKEIDYKEVISYYDMLRTQSENAPPISVHPIAFTFGRGIFLHDFEAICRGFEGRIDPPPHHRVLCSLWLGRLTYMEFEVLADSGIRDALVLGADRQWVSAPTIVPWLSHVLVGLAYAHQPTVAEQKSSYGKNRKYEQRIFNLEVEPETVGPFVRNFLEAGEVMKKETVFDNIPCLDLHLGPQGPQALITCKSCSNHDAMRVKRLGESPTMYLQHFKKQGWKIKGDGKKAECPSCQRSSKSNGVPIGRSVQSQRAIETAMAAKPASVTTPTSKPASSPAAATRAEPRSEPRSEPTVEAPASTGAESRSESRSKQAAAEDSSKADRDDVKRQEGQDEAKKRYQAKKKQGERKRSKKQQEQSNHTSKSVRKQIRDRMARKKKETRRSFTDDFKREVVTVCESLDAEERKIYLHSLDLSNTHYTNWLEKFGSKQQKAPEKVNGHKLDMATQYKLFGLFQQHIDEEARLYEEGWSDERCAQELGIDVQQVIEVREQAIGKLRDPQAEEAKRQMEEITSKFQKDYQDMMAMMDDMKKTYEQQMEELRAKIERSQ